MSSILSDVERVQRSAVRTTDPARKSRLGQFFTPPTIATFMAEMFESDGPSRCRLLDPGAGIGSLSAAFLEHMTRVGRGYRSVQVDAYEVDHTLRPALEQTLEHFRGSLGIGTDVRYSDFIHAAVAVLSDDLFQQTASRYTHAILNPPYKKIRSDSEHRASLRRIGIETVNLYSAFLALSLSLLEPGGQLVAIVPRSFCNGSYYKPFREFLLKRAAIRRVHLFDSRSKAFASDGVLQENIIIRLDAGIEQGPVTISTSADDTFTDLQTAEHPFSRIVDPDDAECFIHIPTQSRAMDEAQAANLRSSLSDLRVAVSTGPVVDFRVKEDLLDEPRSNSVPLLYPSHFNGGGLTWPRVGGKKPNAIVKNERTERLLYPVGYYCVVRRFSAKEEKRRLVARVVDPGTFGDAEWLGFENHLNVFHVDKAGLPRELAHGLSVFLNSTVADERFRSFNGHTQVNATDLRTMKYPSRDTLMRLGRWAIRCPDHSLDKIDERMRALSA